MTQARKFHTRQSGYTLIEVVVAMAVAGIALAGLLHAVAGNAARSALSREYVLATTFGESMLARVGREIALDSGTKRGRIGQKFSWQRTIQPYHADGGTVPDDADAPVSPYEVVVLVTWHSGGRAHEFSIRSLRLKLRDHAPT
jgi:general secretion pathway protein I